MNKKLINSIILLSIFSTLIACNGNDSSKSNSSHNSSSSSSSILKEPSSTSPIGTSTSSSSSVSIDNYEMTIMDFSYFLQNISYDLEANETKTATRNITQVEQQAYAIETLVREESLTAYEGPYAIIEGTENITYKSTDYILGDDYEGFQPKNDSYITFRGVYNDIYYEIDDYNNGKDRDYAGQYEVGNQVSEAELPWRASMQASYFVDYYLYDVFGIYLGDQYELIPNYVNETKELEYFVEYKNVAQDSYGIVYSSAQLFFSMNLDGFITSYTYSYKETAKDYLTENTLGEEYLIYSIVDEGFVTRGNKQAALETLPITPTDYWLQSFDVQIVATLIDEEIICEYDHIPVGYYIEARAINIYPEKALDTQLTILSSSNEEAIFINPYGVVKSMLGGTTTLEIESAAGIQKEVTVSVYEEVISNIVVNIYSTHLYVGETYGIYEIITPENAVDSLVWTVSDENIATVEIDNRGYASLVCHTTGTVTVTATSVKNPTVSGSKTVTVTEKLDEETLKSLITAKEWTNIETPEDVIKFNEDGTGSVTFIDLISEEQGTFEFEWIFAEYSAEEGLLISMTTKVGDYDACFCILSLNGETLEVSFFHQDSALWYYQYVGDFAQAE